MKGFTTSMNPRVPRIVRTPVKSWVKPISSVLGELVNICDDTADDIAVLVGINVAQRKNLQMVEGLRADVLYHPVGDLVVDMVHEPLGKRRNDDHDRNFAKDRVSKR